MQLVFFGAVLAIVGAFFAHMLAAYGLAYIVELNFAGWGTTANILVLMLAFVMGTASLLTVAERKWSAFMQDRIGPNRARLGVPVLNKFALGGIPHFIADGIKMLSKEDFQPRDVVSPFLFKLAPMLAFAPAFALFAVVPAGPSIEVALGSLQTRTVHMYVANPDFGLLYIFAIASLAVYGTSLAGWSSNNKLALLGGLRASSQMISYEVALGLSLVGLMVAFSTLQLGGATGMVEAQQSYLWRMTTPGGFDIGLPAWGIFLQPFGFILFFAAAFAETKRAPFDTPEGESEIVGYFLEYSGMKFGLFMISEFVEVVVLSGVLAAMFFGGYALPFGQEWAKELLTGIHPLLYGAFASTVFWVKVLILCYLQLAVRWTFPRFRYDLVQYLGWKILLPLGLINVFVSAALVLYGKQGSGPADLKPLAILGLIEILALVIATLSSAPKASDSAHAEHEHGASGALHA